MPAYSANAPLSTSNVRATTLLEQCRDIQTQNADYISNIHTRISALIGKLRGHSTEYGEECGEPRPNGGLLGEHKISLEYEGQRLGEIQSDLAVLEELL